jgi:AcrR family transcriptional regulator
MPVDARSARSARTRTRIADAMIAAALAGETRLCFAGVARRADVAVRSVYYHFENMESLFVEALRRYEPRVARIIVTIDRRLTLEARVRMLVAQHDAVYRAIAPLHAAIRANPEALDSPVVRDAMRRLRLALDIHVRETLRDELRAVPDRHAARERITAATSFETWRHLARVQELSRLRRTRHMTTSVMHEFVR